MASQVPCQKNAASGYTFYVGLVSQADTKVLQANPTLAAGDVKIAVDDAAPGNLGTLPAVDADFTKRVKVVLSQAETNGDNLTIIFSDAAGAEWCDLVVNIQTAGQSLDATHARLPAALVGGRMDSNMQAAANGVIAAATFAAGAIDAAALAPDAGTEIAAAVGARQPTEGYAADGAAPTYDQFLFMMISRLFENAISGTTLTAKKLDGTTTAMTFTLDDGTNPTSITRAT